MLSRAESLVTDFKCRLTNTEQGVQHWVPKDATLACAARSRRGSANVRFGLKPDIHLMAALGRKLPRPEWVGSEPCSRRSEQSAADTWFAALSQLILGAPSSLIGRIENSFPWKHAS